ncbi:hypothetical protein THAOC_22550, partial [Thalassiosira oceanica]
MLVVWPATKSPRLDHRRSREDRAACAAKRRTACHAQGTTEQRHSLNRGRRSPLLGANANSADSFDIVFKPGVLDERRGQSDKVTPYTMATFQDRVREIVSRSVATAISSIASDLPARILADPINHDERDCGLGGMTVESDANALRGIAKTLVSIRNARNEPMDSDAAQMRSGPATSVSQCSQGPRPMETISSAYCRRTSANESTETAPAKEVSATSRHAVSRRSLWIRQESQERMKTMSSKDCRLPQVPAVCAPERIPNAAATVDKKEDTKKAVKAIAKRKARGCGRCDGCIREDCGKCAACIDKTKFGGENRKKKRCVHRVCTAMTYNNP